jgi:hypothetical protein
MIHWTPTLFLWAVALLLLGLFWIVYGFGGPRLP